MANPWLGKPCAGCDGKKGKKYATSKFCGNCILKVRRANREASWAAYLLRTYRITAEQYRKLYEFQGGRCYLCQRATGKSKRLAMDHDHACCPSVPTCGKCNRGLLCGTCNKIMGHARDQAGFFERGKLYLLYPPYAVMRAEHECNLCPAPCSGCPKWERTTDSLLRAVDDLPGTWEKSDFTGGQDDCEPVSLAAELKASLA